MKHDRSKHSLPRAMVGCIMGGMLAAFLCNLPVRADAVLISEGANTVSSSTYSTDDPSLVEPCANFSGDSCMLVAAYNEGIYCCGWYSGNDNGIENVAIFLYINYVYDVTYRTDNGGDVNDGAIAVVGPSGKTYTFQGAEGQGNCTNEAYYQQGWDVGSSYSDGIVYTLAIPFSCS